MTKQLLFFLFKNFSPLQTLAKNSFWIIFGRFSAGILRAILVVVAARTLGVGNFGSFTLAMNFVLIFSFLPEFGFTAILTRELSKRELEPQKVFSLLFLLTLAFSLLTYIVIIGSAPIFVKDKAAAAIVSILALMMIFDILREFTYGVFRAEEKMEKQGLLHFATNLLLFGLAMYFLKTNPQLHLLADAYLISIFVGAVSGCALIWPYLKQLRLRIDWLLFFRFFHSAWPIALANFLFLLLLYLDSVILGWFHSPYHVGLYNSTIKLTEFLVFFPQAIALAVFPMFSRSITNREKLKHYLELALKLSAVLMFPIVAGVFVLGERIIETIFSASYLAAGPALKLIIFSLLGTFPFLILSNLLIALDKRKELLIFDLILVAINFSLNLILVPKFHFYASAYLTTLTSLLGFLFAYFISQKYVLFEFNRFLPKPFGAAAIMGAILFIVKNSSLVLTLPLGVALYLLLLYVFKEDLTVKVTQKK